MLQRRARRDAPQAPAGATARRGDVAASRGHAAALAVRLSAPARVGLGVPRRRPRRGATQRRGHDAQGVVGGRRAVAAGDCGGGRGRATEDVARPTSARRERAGRNPRRPRRPDRRRDLGSRARRRRGDDRRARGGAPGPGPRVPERAEGLGGRDRRRAVRLARDRRGSRARDAAPAADTRAGDRGVARRALRPAG